MQPTFFQLLTQLASQQTPAMIWYSQPGERIELSGKVFMNWVYKTANLLDDELDFADSPQALLSMPSHWRAYILATAVLLAGGEVDFQADPTKDYGILATSSAREAERALAEEDAEYILAVAKAPLAPRFEESLSPDIVDYCAQVRSFADMYFPLAPVAPSAPAGAGLSHQDALAQVAEQAQTFADQETSAWVLKDQALSWESLLIFLALLASGKTAILCDPTIEWDQERLTRVLADEKAKMLETQKY